MHILEPISHCLSFTAVKCSRGHKTIVNQSILYSVGVKNACCAFLEKQLDSSNCLGIKLFAEQHSCQELFDAADMFGLKHFEEVVIQEEFLSLPLHQVEPLFTCNEIQVCDCLLLKFHI